MGERDTGKIVYLYRKQEIARLYWENRNLMKEDIFGEDERELYYRTTVKMDDVTAQDSLRNLSVWMERYYGKKKK